MTKHCLSISVPKNDIFDLWTKRCFRLCFLCVRYIYTFCTCYPEKGTGRGSFSQGAGGGGRYFKIVKVKGKEIILQLIVISLVKGKKCSRFEPTV